MNGADVSLIVFIILYAVICFITLVKVGGRRRLPNKDERQKRKRDMIANRNAELLKQAMVWHEVALRERRMRNWTQLQKFNEQAGFDPEPPLEFQEEPKPKRRAPLTPTSLDEVVRQNKNYERGRMAKSAQERMKPVHLRTFLGTPLCDAGKTPCATTSIATYVTCPACIGACVPIDKP